MKQGVLIFGKCIMILILGGIIGTLLLTLSFKIPVNMQNAVAARETVYLEGQRPMANTLYSQGGTFIVNFHPAMLDNGTDSLMLETVFAQGDNLLQMAMDMNSYPRYWHGYFLVLRVLLYFMSYNDLRILNCILQIALIIMIMLVLWDSMKKKRYLLAFFTSYILLTPLALPFSLQYTWVFYIAFGGVLFAIRKKEFMLRKSHYIFSFLIIGALTAFFDLLTFPLITWAFPLVWWLVVCGENLNGRKRLEKVVGSGISWIGGYGGFWLLKWVVATPILGYNVVADGIQEVFFRVGGLTEFEKRVFQAYEKWETLYCNWRYYEYGIYAVIIAAWMLWALFYGIRYGWRVRLKSGVFLLIIASSIVWYLTLANHTTVHAFFAHRIFVIGILGCICFLLECCMPLEEHLNVQCWYKYMERVFVWFVFAAIGLWLARFAREDINVINGVDYQEIPLYEGQTFRASFIPSYDQITKIGFCLRSIEGNGRYRIEILHDSQVLYYLESTLSDYKDSTYHEEMVNWILNTQEEYQIQISIYESTGENFILMTQEGKMPLSEYRDACIDTVVLDGQPLGAFVYHARLQSKWRLAYAALMWMILLGAAASMVKAVLWDKIMKERIRKRDRMVLFRKARKDKNEKSGEV